MNPRILTLGVSALSLATVACAPTGDDTDDNKSYFIDDYKESTAPAPPTDDTACNYSIAQALGQAGVATGNVIPIGHNWEGFRPFENTPSTINVAELFDCDGSRGIDAIVFDTSQYG